MQNTAKKQTKKEHKTQKEDTQERKSPQTNTRQARYADTASANWQEGHRRTMGDGHTPIRDDPQENVKPNMKP